MGKNTPTRQEFIISNLKIEKGDNPLDDQEAEEPVSEILF
jgi:topoisomerase-4 subunit B